ncbi:MAG: Smr/MutS family protein [Sphaerochaetaceae bacterium]|nr:Smr/MutS family protein [Sphaerochaetaceae bacterium]
MKQSFAEIFSRWEEEHSEEKKNKKSKTEETRHVSPVVSKPFSDIYSQWENIHDEKRAIEESKSFSEPEADHSPTISELRRMKVQDCLDLHEKFLEQSLELTEKFIDSSWEKGYRKIRIITGKGIHSPGGEAVLRPSVIKAVKKNRHVREYDLNPPASEGGSGAIILILKENK